MSCLCIPSQECFPLAGHPVSSHHAPALAHQLLYSLLHSRDAPCPFGWVVGPAPRLAWGKMLFLEYHGGLPAARKHWKALVLFFPSGVFKAFKNAFLHHPGQFALQPRELKGPLGRSGSRGMESRAAPFWLQYGTMAPLLHANHAAMLTSCPPLSLCIHIPSPSHSAQQLPVGRAAGGTDWVDTFLPTGFCAVPWPPPAVPAPLQRQLQEQPHHHREALRALQSLIGFHLQLT